VAENISSFICNSAIVYIYSIKSTRNLNPSQRTEKMSGRTRTWREIKEEARGHDASAAWHRVAPAAAAGWHQQGRTAA
jgi:hypothetical protein